MVTRGFANFKTELGVKRQRTIVKGGLDEAHAGIIFLRDAVQGVLHEAAADGLILHFRVDGDGTDAGNGIAFEHEVAPGDDAIHLGDDRINAGMRKAHGNQALGHFGGGNVGREIVLAGKFREMRRNKSRRSVWRRLEFRVGESLAWGEN